MFDVDTYWFPPGASPLDVQDQEEIDAVRDQATQDGTQLCVLYRYFDDGLRLLYVGITTTPYVRRNRHSNDSEFWEFAECGTTVLYPSVTAALRAEAVAIGTEYPVFNIAGRPRDHAVQLVKQYLDQRLGSRA